MESGLKYATLECRAFLPNEQEVVCWETLRNKSEINQEVREQLDSRNVL